MNTPPLFQQKMLRAALERFDLAQIPNLTQKRDILVKWKQIIESSYQPKKLSTTLHAFHTLAFKEFVKELKKQKVTLSKQDEFELLDLFEAQKSQALALQQQIDRMVYELYGLTEEEIRIVEGS